MARCRSCKAEIIWAVTVKGKKIPLDAGSETRFVFTGGGVTGDSAEVETAETYQSHFATCPDAEDWRS